MSNLIIICGSTCSGKTSLAINVAKQLNTNIISADSMCVYKDFNIGTAKPTHSEMQQVKHYMIDVASPFVNYSISDYKNNAEPICDKLIKENKYPIICGGTGFYINSLIYDYSYGGGGENIEIRENLKKEAEEFGKDYMWHKLEIIDEEASKKIEKNDLKRVIRALEIYYSTGLKKSEIKDSDVPKRHYNAFCIDYPRDELYRRIEIRVDQMIENGLIDEVKSLINKGLTLENNAMQGIGYKEIYSYLNGEISNLKDAIDLIKLNTRHYAKRQKTFFKKLPNLIKLNPNDGIENMTKQIIESL